MLLQTSSGSRPPAAGSGPPPQDPLVIDLDGAGPRTTGAEGAQVFDLAGDGVFKPTSFVTGGTAFLALDRNGDGKPVVNVAFDSNGASWGGGGNPTDEWLRRLAWPLVEHSSANGLPIETVISVMLI